jgi:cell division transport system permease protein
MVYLAVMMLAGAMVLARVAAEWDNDLTGNFTVQVAAPESGPATAHDEQVQVVIGILRKTTGIADVQAVPADVTAKSLAPWLGPDADLREFPLPRVIGVTLGPSADVDFEALAKQLRKAVPGAELDNHEFWREQITSLVGALEVLVLLVVMLITASTMAAVMFATRSGVAIHREVIEVLHLIGAADENIAQEFKRQARHLALLGSLPGLLLALATLLGIGQLAGRVDSLLLPAASFSWWHWIALAAVPIFATVIATITARHTVLRALRQML